MENLLQGLSHVVMCFGDMLMTGRNDQEHLENLDRVLTRLKQARVKLKLGKCDFLVPQVKYLGHVVTSAGFQPDPEKTSSAEVIKAFRCQDITEPSWTSERLPTVFANLSSALQPLNHPAANMP